VERQLTGSDQLVEGQAGRAGLEEYEPDGVGVSPGCG
jgi:hypothetical protein